MNAKKHLYLFLLFFIGCMENPAPFPPPYIYQNIPESSSSQTESTPNNKIIPKDIMEGDKEKAPKSYCKDPKAKSQNINPLFVEATGYGRNFQSAKEDALRNAVEKGIGIRIFSETMIQNFKAIKDVIHTESFGIVRNYEILYKQNKGDQGWQVKIKALVAKDIRSKWDKIRVIIEQKGNPKIMFCIKEIINNRPLTHPIGEYQLVQKFNELGFIVIDRKSFEDTRELQKQIYNLEQNYDGIISISSERGADLLVMGILEGNFSQYQEGYGGVWNIVYTYHLRTKIIRTDTAQIIGSTSKTFQKIYDSLQYNVKSAGKAGLNSIIRRQYIKPMIVDMIKTWIREKGTLIKVIISNVKYNLRKKILEKLRAHSSVRSVRIEHYRNKRLKLSIKSNLNTEQLASKLENVENLPLEVIELKKNTLELRYKAKKFQ